MNRCLIDVTENVIENPVFLNLCLNILIYIKYIHKLCFMKNYNCDTYLFIFFVLR